ncbi:hypothetical protein, conserved [Plasmodium vivax]|nr:hypothetical protein, conserved [Plasmodium vivax]
MTQNQCASHTGDYFNYDCYKRLSYYFDGINFSETSQKYFNDYIQSFANQRSFVKQNNDLLTYLAKRLGGDGLFIDIGYDICCTYINYLLNYKIENKNNGSLENYFENFKHFADYYAEKKSRTLSNQNTCKGYLKPIINENKYNIMKTLYKIYNFFNQVKSSNVYYQKEKICEYYALVNLYFRDLKNNYNTDNKLMEKLNYFARVVKNSGYSYDNLCGINLLSFMFPPPVSKPEPKMPEISGQPSRANVISDSQNRDVLEQHADGTGSANQQGLLEKTKVSESLSEEPQITDLPNKESVQGNLAAVSLPGLSEEKHHRDRTFESLNIRPEVEMNTPEYGVINREEDFTSIQGHLPQSEGESKGILNNVHDTFFSIVKDVQPAPILGVSGGMGALFLLFKYTPVGSFFGGRRGRIRQIPRSFGGFAPGNFANFQEYDGGFIGYGPTSISHLAE